MKFSVHQESLIYPLQLVSGAVEKRQTLPVLGNILLRVENSVLALTATDLEIEISAKIDLSAPSIDGEITVPARKFLEIWRSLSQEETINVYVEDNRLKIASGRSKFSLSTISASEFPNIEETVFSRQIEVATSDFKRLLDRTQFAMAQQDVRYYLNGMLLELSDSQLLSVATDGHRLAMSKLDLVDTEESSQVIQAIVPRKGVTEAGKLLSSQEQSCRLEFNSNHLRISLANYVFTSKLIDGRFPDYQKVLPKNAQRILVGEKEDLKDAFSRASILCNEKFRGVRLNLDKNRLSIHANNPEQEEAQIELDVDYDDEVMEIGFNVSYLLDALNAIKSERIRFNLGDANSSVLIESAENSESMYVIMPMRL